MSSTSAAARASSSPGRGHDRGRHDPRTRAGAGPEPFETARETSADAEG
ncbi:hypothetical protein [Nocardiopsis alba]